MNIYQENGFASREDYFGFLADDKGVSLDAVQAVADVLGPDEDFDGLPAMLDDATAFYGDDND